MLLLPLLGRKPLLCSASANRWPRLLCHAQKALIVSRQVGEFLVAGLNVGENRVAFFPGGETVIGILAENLGQPFALGFDFRALQFESVHLNNDS
jgi:hypothetical protein